MIVKEIMNCHVVSVKPNDTLDTVLNIMNQHNINGTPVVNESDDLIGMIVKADIYRFLMDPGHYKSCPVEWVMTKEVIYGQADEDLLAIVKRLRHHDIVALPILENNRVAGIISLEDLLDYYIQTQEK